jgi:hypothetical protein
MEVTEVFVIRKQAGQCGGNAVAQYYQPTSEALRTMDCQWPGKNGK